MADIVVGYGEYKGYRLSEVPQQILEELAKRFPLRVKEGSSAEYAELLVTVGIHEEINRRANGGEQDRHLPSLRQCAADIISRGYQQASKVHHPDGKGDHEAQLRLTNARDQLRKAVSSFPDDIDEDAQTIIPALGQSIRGPSSRGITDEDIPF